LFEYLIWCLVVQGFSWSVVETFLDMLFFFVALAPPFF